MLSMTGYGRARVCRDGRELTLEMKAVNHRFLDLSIRVPKSLPFLEDALRTFAQHSDLLRGHVELSITYQNTRQDAQTIVLDESILKAFNASFQHAQPVLSGYAQPNAAEVITLCNALSVNQADEDTEAVTAMASEAFGTALASLLSMRKQEGKHLAADLLVNLSLLAEIRQKIEGFAPAVPLEYKERLETRMAQWQLDSVEPQRIAQEVAIMADHCAIDEELNRLLSHIEQFRDIVANQNETGKKLDFLLQEMNREVNTMGSKAGNTQIIQCVVDAKCIIEKLREQVQNAL